MILIIQNGRITPCIPKYLTEMYEVYKSSQTDFTKLDLDKYSLIIILGGDQTLTNIFEYKYLLNVVNFIHKCFENNKPILGFCLGCQLIGYAMGCKIVSSGKLNVGYDCDIMNYKNVFRCHIDYIIPNEKITVIEYFEQMPYLIKFRNNVYGVQCHPEITPECVKKYCHDVNACSYADTERDLIHQINQSIVDKLIGLVIFE